MGFWMSFFSSSMDLVTNVLARKTYTMKCISLVDCVRVCFLQASLLLLYICILSVGAEELVYVRDSSQQWKMTCPNLPAFLPKPSPCSFSLLPPIPNQCNFLQFLNRMDSLVHSHHTPLDGHPAVNFWQHQLSVKFSDVVMIAWSKKPQLSTTFDCYAFKQLTTERCFLWVSVL